MTEEILKISVLEDDKIMEAIFGKQLPKVNKTNLFGYEPSSGYYEPNKVRIQVGFVFNTPTGRETKIYPYLNIVIKEDVISGECEWVSNPNTPKKILDKIRGYLNTSTLDFYFKGYRLKRNYKNGIKYFVVSTGSGGSPLYRLEFDDI